MFFPFPALTSITRIGFPPSVSEGTGNALASLFPQGSVFFFSFFLSYLQTTEDRCAEALLAVFSLEEEGRDYSRDIFLNGGFSLPFFFPL